MSHAALVARLNERASDEIHYVFVTTLQPRHSRPVPTGADNRPEYYAFNARSKLSVPELFAALKDGPVLLERLKFHRRDGRAFIEQAIPVTLTASMVGMIQPSEIDFAV